ncbi:MAG TPA: ABC transporter permease [Sporichthya sp.]|nr:ABC transporter permease [Sporichthya sp.]
MLRFVIRRLLGAAVILAVISLATFLLFFAIPGDPGRLACGKSCTPERLADIRTSLGINRPILEQYWEYMKGVFVGRDFTQAGEKVHCGVPCFGYSFTNQQPVWQTLVDRFPATLSLALGASVLFLVVGVGLGAVSALRTGSLFDRIGIGFALIGSSVQIFFLGPLLNNVFVNQLGWIPQPRYVPLTDDPIRWFQGLLLPWIVLAFVSIAIYARLTRASMIEALSEDFVRAGRARGLPARTLHIKHTGRATVTPVMTVFGLDLAGLLGGAIITETVFNIQGIGKLALTSLNNSDLPMIMATVLIAAIFIVIANLVVDIAYALVDPRVRIT